MEYDCKIKGDKGKKGRRSKEQDNIYNNKHIRAVEILLSKKPKTKK